MSRTHHPNKEEATGNMGNKFDANVSACMILGRVMEAVGYNIQRHPSVASLWQPSSRFSMSEEECMDAATKLEALPDARIQLIFENVKDCMEEDATYMDLKTYIAEWARFLKTCGGYTV